MKLNNKEILIDNDSRLIDVQRAFSANYPFLKIDFLQITKGTKSLKTSNINPAINLMQLSNLSLPGKIDIDNNRTVSELSHFLETSLGVIVQVSRRSGNVWTMISVTDGWTLERQNTAGESISLQMAAARNLNPDKNYFS
jgi:hypothetical protein